MVVDGCQSTACESRRVGLGFLFVRRSCVRDLRKSCGSGKRGAEDRDLYFVGTRISWATALEFSFGKPVFQSTEHIDPKITFIIALSLGHPKLTLG